MASSQVNTCILHNVYPGQDVFPSTDHFKAVGPVVCPAAGPRGQRRFCHSCHRPASCASCVGKCRVSSCPSSPIPPRQPHPFGGFGLKRTFILNFDTPVVQFTSADYSTTQPMRRSSLASSAILRNCSISCAVNAGPGPAGFVRWPNQGPAGFSGLPANRRLSAPFSPFSPISRRSPSRPSGQLRA